MLITCFILKIIALSYDMLIIFVLQKTKTNQMLMKKIYKNVKNLDFDENFLQHV